MRFTIRDVLWLTVVAGLGLAWTLTASRSALLEARLKYAERQDDQLRALRAEFVDEQELNLAMFGAIKTAIEKAELSEE